jgi:hypothetical protein
VKTRRNSMIMKTEIAAERFPEWKIPEGCH